MMVCAGGLRARLVHELSTWWRVGYWVAGGQWLNRESNDGFTTAHVAWIRSRLPSPRGRASAATVAPRRLACPLRVAAFGYEHL
jgi:hypothetical protein